MYKFIVMNLIITDWYKSNYTLITRIIWSLVKLWLFFIYRLIYYLKWRQKRQNKYYSILLLCKSIMFSINLLYSSSPKNLYIKVQLYYSLWPLYNFLTIIKIFKKILKAFWVYKIIKSIFCKVIFCISHYQNNYSMQYTKCCISYSIKCNSSGIRYLPHLQETGHSVV